MTLAQITRRLLLSGQRYRCAVADGVVAAIDNATFWLVNWAVIQARVERQILLGVCHVR